MKLPNKVTSYKKSILSKFPVVLNKIKNEDYPVNVLYREVANKLSIYEFIEVLDCLFALNQITLRKEIIHYAKRNTF